MIRVKCPQCAKVLGLNDDVAGKMAKCPSCTATFKVPAAPAPKAAAPAKPKNGKPKAEAKAQAKPAATPATPGNDELNPYAFAQDVGPADKEAIRDDRIDAMVRDARRTKKRNSAWEQIGLPSKLMKRFVLGELVLIIVIYLYTVMAVVLFIHQQDQWQAKGRNKDPKDRPKYVWPVNEFVQRETPPSTTFWVATGVFVPLLCIYGVMMSAAEAMKKLESYRLVMVGTIICCIFAPPIGILSLLVLLRKPIQHEFEVSERRKQGIFEEEDEVATAEEENEEDEEENEEAEKEVAVEE